MTAPRLDHAFHQLHQSGLLVLANAWDAGSARVIESLGAKAIATTSAGIAWAHGYQDGDQLPVAILAATVAEIARVVALPLTVDLEGGYSDDPAIVEDNVAAVVAAGAVGINLEDGTADPALLSAKIAAAKRGAARHGVELFVNARTDVSLRGLVPPAQRIAEVVAREERYRDAGADGIFVPGLADSAEIAAIAAAVRLPLNLLARPHLPNAASLAGLGVRRLSSGSGITQSIYGSIARLAADFLKDGASEKLAEGAMPYPAINALMAAG